MTMGWLSGQKVSRGDKYYFQYAFDQAVEAYQEEMRKEPLSLEQQLNLADAYFRTGQYNQASDAFMEVYKKDSLMTNAQFNTMLQALSKTSGPERARAFLRTRSDQLSESLLENAAFNYETLEDIGTGEGTFRIFTLNINSPESDFAPSFYGPDRLLFSSARPLASKETYAPSGESYLSIFSTSLTENGQAVRPGPLSWIPGVAYHQATPQYSEAMKGVFFVQSNTGEEGLAYNQDGKNTLAICRALESGGFEYLFRDLSTSFYYPFYDETSGKLYFAADFGQGYGGTDLYYVYTNRGQIMSQPVNLGPQINTPGNEIAPYIFDGSLYFSSDVFYGYGGMDVYKSEIQGEDFFSIPVNLGPWINTVKDEFGFIIRTRPGGGYTGYFSSNRPGGVGGDDIYGFAGDEKPGLKTLMFRGRVQDLSSLGIGKAYVRLYDPSGGIIEETYTGEDGSFNLEIPWREGVEVAVGKQRYETRMLGNTGTDPDLGSGQPMVLSLTPVDAVVLPLADRTLLRLDPFHFSTGSTEISPEASQVLDQAAESLKKFPGLRIRIEAHTDSRGNASTNLRLSQRRAEAIRDYLISQGVAPETITEVAGYGEQQIINNCTDGVYCLDMLHKQNERYPFVVLNFDEL